MNSYEGRCGICGEKGESLNCHEEWVYDDEFHVRTLKRILPLCEWCHWVKHAYLAKGKAGFGHVDFRRVVRQFMDVNECSHKVFFAELDKQIEICEERSMHDWQTDFGEYQHLADQFT